MPRARAPRIVYWLALLLAISAATGRAQTGASAEISTPEVTLTPAIVEVGSPELIRVRVPKGARLGAATPNSAELEGEWLNQKLQFFRGRDGQAWYALAGVDVKAAAGQSTLRITAHTATGAAHAGGPPPADDNLIDLSRTVQILPAHYRTGALTVAPKFVEPGPDELTRIKAEVELKAKLFAASATAAAVVGRFSRAGSCAAD